jgi:murein DD-endopeptidase MepM/ murein hydrolase activator NlpD
MQLPRSENRNMPKEPSMDTTPSSTRMHSRNEYALPLRAQESRIRGSPAHKGKLKHSIDFRVPEGTPVHAALAGKVVFVKQDSDVGGPSKRKYWNLGNRIVIEHRSEEYTAYEHLRYLGSSVKEGQRVRTGQLIGYSGNTGYTYEPHLHFEVFVRPRKDKSEGSTLVPRFRNEPRQTWVRIRKAQRRRMPGREGTTKDQAMGPVGES